MPIASKMRMTRQRQAILDELVKLKTHPTADEIYQIVKQRMPRISLGTVYRNLDLLAQTGQIRRLDTAQGQKRYDGDLSQHYHVHCVDCGKIGDVVLERAPGEEPAVASSSDYEILDRRVEYLGVCPQCKSEREAADSRIPGVAFGRFN